MIYQAKKNIYRIPLRFLIDLGLVNFLISFDTRYIFTLERDLNRLFQSKRKVNSALEPNAKIIIFKTSFISYPEIQLNENFEAYFNSVLKSKTALRTGIQTMPYLQSFEINVGSQSLVVTFVRANRQFTFLELSLVYDKSDQHKTIYDSHNLEVGTQKIKSLKIENASSTYALTNEIKYNVDDAEDAYWLYAQFFAFVCNGCTIAPLIDYANNPAYQDLTKTHKYFDSNEKMYLDLRRS